MGNLHSNHDSRRRFIRLLAATPLLPQLDLPRSWLQAALQERELIGAPSEALNVFDFEPVAKKKLPPAHWGYLATGSDDDGTLRANREGMTRYQLRMRRLVDVSKIDMSVNIFGKTYPTPIVINPVGSNKAFHPEGEIAVARASRAKGNVQVLSTVATTSVEDASAARGDPVWFQLYHRQDWNQTLQMIRRAEHAGCPAIVFTVDLLGGSNRETLERYARVDSRDCSQCHSGGAPVPGRSGRVDDRDNRRKPALAEFVPGTPIPEVGTPTWEFVQRLRDSTKMKVLIKGIVTKEDAELAMRRGIDGVFVSNHGGRAEDSGRATIECVSEVVAGVRGRGVVIVDGGFRRGTDAFKALALGATAVGIGRPYVWGLASFGQQGVETVLDILHRELQTVMKQAGTTSIAKITNEYVIDRNARS
ncbi:MAG: alpha-hydroxy acid oxidase [Gemmatimonadetes bacterium]|nr:alpha-hydroxy acid oxidase [Gemmatimonadota bacterium]